MIGLKDSTNTRLSILYNGLYLNLASDAVDNTYQVDMVVPATQFDTITDPSPGTDGMEGYNVFKAARLITMKGVIKAPDIPTLYDKIKALAAAFDPAKITHENSNGGFLALEFSVPTNDTTNYATGLVPSFYWARPRMMPEPMDSVLTGTAAFFHLDMLLIDPNRYFQTQQTLAGAGTATNTLADYRSYPTITLTAGGAGLANYTYACSSSLGSTSLVLNLTTLVNTDVLTIDAANKRILKSGLDVTGTYYVSGDYPVIEPLANTITLTNVTNITTSTAWYRAFCL